MLYIKRFDTLSGQTEYLNSVDIDTYVGYVNENQTVYYDDALPKPLPYEEQYLTFVAEADNLTIQLRYAPSSVFQYSVDNGATWVTLPNNESTSSVNTGGKILFKASGSNPNYYMLTPSANASVQGNIMSLVYGDNFIGQTTIENANQFRTLFSTSPYLTSAENLVLPATTLADGCYYNMFYNCTSLTVAPELPATTLERNCYVNMFRGCTSLTTAPSILPATTVAGSCYSSMFNGCTSLTTAPELPATTLAEGCYSFMFNGCSNLNYIKCLATNISAWACTNNWVGNVASTGTFVKDANTTWSTGVNGIPDNWTIENE